MRLTIIPGDKAIGIGGEFLLKIQEDLSWIPSNVRAVQWYDTWGEIEYGDGFPNEKIEELGIYEQATQVLSPSSTNHPTQILTKFFYKPE
jgi:hypothetical protein